MAGELSYAGAAGPRKIEMPLLRSLWRALNWILQAGRSYGALARAERAMDFAVSLAKVIPMPQTAIQLEPPDSHHLLAAHGWLELNNASEAGEEIARISSSNLEHPDVLEARWAVCAAGERWEAGLEVADTLLRVAPDRASGWLHRAYALRRLKGGGLERAWEALRPGYDKFPRAEVIPYNLACYSAQMGRLDEAWEWLHKAMEAAGDVDAVKSMALADSDLNALWDRIRTL